MDGWCHAAVGPGVHEEAQVLRHTAEGQPGSASNPTNTTIQPYEYNHPTLRTQPSNPMNTTIQPYEYNHPTVRAWGSAAGGLEKLPVPGGSDPRERPCCCDVAAMLL